MANQGRLQGRIALITGAANGIGRGCALRFAREGALVIALDADQAALAALAEEANAHSLSIETTDAVDLTDPKATSQIIAGVGRRCKQFDILVNAAAVATFAWIEDLSAADWRRTLQGELDIVFLPTQAAWPYLKSSRSASIINFASANAFHALEGSPALAHCAGKGGVLAMTRQLAMEGAPHAIRANTISPGFICTAATERHLSIDPRLKERVLAKNMLKMLGEPDDIAWCAVWLGSNESRYVTGTDIRVDGGATAW